MSSLSFACNCIVPFCVLSGCCLIPFALPRARFFGRHRVQCTSPAIFFPPPRPLRSLSLALSRSVPMNRCKGLTHEGVSHLWQTIDPSGIEPKLSAQENLCATTVLRLMPKCPYPSRVLDPFHVQQESSPLDLSTNLQNRTHGSSLIGLGLFLAPHVCEQHFIFFESAKNRTLHHAHVF